MTDEQRADRLAGAAAIAACGCWVTWAVVNTVTHGGFDHGVPGSRAIRAAALLTAGWNVLLVPGLIRLHRRLAEESPGLAPIWSVAGLLSLSFWALGGITTITGPLETVYLALAATWLLGAGRLVRERHATFAVFTIIVGAFTGLDAVFTLFEPMPFALYALASPKLPLGAAWSMVLGIMLLAGRLSAGGALPGAVRAPRAAREDRP
jgi:hypothetical protein